MNGLLLLSVESNMLSSELFAVSWNLPCSPALITPENRAGSCACGNHQVVKDSGGNNREMSFPRYQKFPPRRYQKLSGWPVRDMRGADMSTQDHNKTLVMLYAAVASFYSCGIIAAPWIIEKNFRRAEQIPSAILVFGLVFLIALLFWLSAIYMHRRRPIGRTLALVAAPITLFAFWPIGIYCWWFMHTVGAKSLYGISEGSS